MTETKKTLADVGRVRTDSFIAAIRRAMAQVDKEVKDNEGVYPHNSGRINAAELFRRAGVSQTSLYGPKHKASTRLEVEQWLHSLRAHIPVTTKGARKRSQSQALSWKEKYDLMAAQFKNMYSVEIVQRDAEIESLRQEVLDLKQQVQAMQNGGKVVRFAGRAKQ
ncbi:MULTISPECIES: hypothetical protein [unclassified Stenotrophomonas]|uniref:hypothetical protein n=1 Tax=unclassified Stenotrophomonas TaxID=196198 RepID=UPI0015E65613|nr:MULTISPECIES: hypothetical protein [unclassified Stenotrophomonas]